MSTTAWMKTAIVAGNGSLAATLKYLEGFARPWAPPSHRVSEAVAAVRCLNAKAQRFHERTGLVATHVTFGPGAYIELSCPESAAA